MTDEREKFLKKLRGLGEEDVRTKHATNHFGPPDSKRSHWAQEWLREKDKENDIVESPEVKQQTVKQQKVNQQEIKQKEEISKAAVDKNPLASSQAKNTNVVKTALLIGCISLIIFIVTLCSGPPG